MPQLTKSLPVISYFFLSISICFFFILRYGAKAIDDDQTINIGAILHMESRVGREQRTAAEIAVEDFNANSKNLKLSIHYRNSTGEPLQSALAAQRLIQEEQAQVIFATGEWQEAALVADVGSKFRVPTLLFSEPAITPSFASLTRPYMVRIARNLSEQIKCFADLVNLYQWRRVIVIYEDEPYGGDSGSFNLLAKALQKVGSKIEYRLSLPPLASVSNPKKAVQQELDKLISEKCYSRVFIVLHVSQTLASHLFMKANERGLAGNESVWVITESIVDYLPSFNDSTLSSMEGVLGLKTDYRNSSDSFEYFVARFWSNFSKQYPEEQHPEPGFHALRAYDAVTAIGKAAKRLSSNKNTSLVFLEHILSTNFTGLSGEIYFEEGKIAQRHRSYSLVNLVDKNLVQVDLWTPVTGFSGNQALAGNVTWPGGLNTFLAPKGWAMPMSEKPMNIGIPFSHAFKNFVEVFPEKNNYSGICIELFTAVVSILGYDLPHIFHPFNGTYEELVDCVYNKTFDAAVGDLTALANRTDYVDFTQPFAESGLAIILPIESDFKKEGWTFVRPFKRDLWIATFGILMYTTLIVWFLEHRNNPEFRGSWTDQLSTALLFTFSSLFFAQREDIRSSYTKVVLVVWFFVVLILSQSYTADLSSMLTVARLNQNETDIETLVLRNATVGCHNESFVKPFLENVLKFRSDNILGIETEFDYFLSNFTNGNMTAAFLEIPYARLFQNQYCDDYTMTISDYRFGGLGFVFPKGSPVAVDVSRAILTLTENGTLKTLEEKWLNTTSKCSTDQSDGSSNNETESLTLRCFWGLFVLSIGTCTLCLLGSFISKYRQYRREVQDTLNSNGNVNVPLSFASYVVGGESGNLTDHIRFGGGGLATEGYSPSSWVVIDYQEVGDDR